MGTVWNRARGWMVLASLVAGCALDVASEDGADVARQEQALWLQAPSYDPEPPQTQIPDCWWVDQNGDCDEVPECVPPAPSSDRGSLTLRSARSITPTRTATLAARSPGSTGSGAGSTSTSLDLKAKDPCPSPDGVGTCSTCNRKPGQPWKATIDLSLASRVLITNGLNASYLVKNYPVLNAKAYAEDDSILDVEVDLTLGTTTMQSGQVNLTEDLYMFFTSDFDTGPYPVGNWVFCPKNGNTCVQVTD